MQRSKLLIALATTLLAGLANAQPGAEPAAGAYGAWLQLHSTRPEVTEADRRAEVRPLLPAESLKPLAEVLTDHAQPEREVIRPGQASSPVALPPRSGKAVRIDFPDVCRTPSPAGAIPIPYPDIGRSEDTTGSVRLCNRKEYSKSSETRPVTRKVEHRGKAYIPTYGFDAVPLYDR